MDKKKGKIHTKPSKLGTYLGKKAGVSEENLRDTDENLLDTDINSEEINLEAEQPSDTLQSKAPNSVSQDKTPKPKNSWLKKLSVVFMTLTVVAVVYAGLYILAPVIIIVPAALLYLIWFVIVAIVSIVTIGVIWVSDGWKNFSQGFLDFNNGLWSFANRTTEVLANTFTGFTIGFGVCIAASIAISAVGMSSKRFSHEKYKASMIASIILGVVFVAFTILNIYFIYSGKSVI